LAETGFARDANRGVGRRTHEKTGRWPIATDGRVYGAADETWMRIDNALRAGRRGLPGGDSLAKLLARHRGVRNKKALPRLNARHIS
jgi:hypothetical protein